MRGSLTLGDGVGEAAYRRGRRARAPANSRGCGGRPGAARNVVRRLQKRRSLVGERHSTRTQSVTEYVERLRAHTVQAPQLRLFDAGDLLKPEVSGSLQRPAGGRADPGRKVAVGHVDQKG